MHDTKTGPARASFWCGILTAEKRDTPTQARTVRGPYTAFTLANSRRDKTGGTTGLGTMDDEGEKEEG